MTRPMRLEQHQRRTDLGAAVTGQGPWTFKLPALRIWHRAVWTALSCNSLPCLRRRRGRPTVAVPGRLRPDSEPWKSWFHR